jgi:hypothetical protein
MDRREDFATSSNKLSPISDETVAKEKVLNWIQQSVTGDSCINLLQDMELAHEDEVFFEGSSREIEQGELYQLEHEDVEE